MAFEMTLLAFIFLWLAVTFAFLFLATFSDGEGDIVDDEPTLDVQNHRGDRVTHDR